MAIGPNADIAIWVVTPNGMDLARRLQARWPGATISCSQRLAADTSVSRVKPFQRLTRAVAEDFHLFDGHIFIMAAGIVVRAIAPWLKDKTVDPATVVVDDQGKHAISLLAGHIGGANGLAVRTAECLGAIPVITTATDVNAKPAIDTLAVDQDLMIENPTCIKAVNMALLTGDRIQVHDPFGLITCRLERASRIVPMAAHSSADKDSPGIYVDDVGAPQSPRALVLRPASLVAGIGCNRHTPKEEIRALLETVCERFGLSLNSLRKIASIDVKHDEDGLLALGEALGKPIQFFSREELNQIHRVPTPSAMVAKHVGVQSVCEAAAILAAHRGTLIVPKQITTNVTVAIARHSSLSSVSAPVV